VVLATLVKTSGSTPQKPGNSALFCEKGLIAGTIGGGQLEGDVDQIAQHALISGTSGQYYFNLDSHPDTAGAICGGEAEVLVDADPGLHKSAFEEMERDLSRRIPGHICTLVSKGPGQDFSICRFWVSEQEHSGMPGYVTPELWQTTKAMLETESGKGFIESDLPSLSGAKQSLFIESIKPMPHLVIAGAGHVGRALAHLASLLDFEITVIDDRQEFACLENIPDADHFIVKDIGVAMSELEKGPDTYIVIVTRDHRNDADALKPCIGSGAAYVGMIGSRHKVAIVKKNFIETGLATEEQWDRVHTPIGIPIESKTVQEIATSIAAQLVSERAKNQPGHA
jgi:xanthine dehydrogenase accessory factor